MSTREEEYLRRMRALGYEPDLRGMDDGDIEWELSKMEEADRRREAEWQQPLRTVYRPVDPGLKARILRMFGQPYDESAIPKGQEFYLNGWDNGEDEEYTAPTMKTGPNYYAATSGQTRKSDWGAGGNSAYRINGSGTAAGGRNDTGSWPLDTSGMFTGEWLKNQAASQQAKASAPSEHDVGVHMKDKTPANTPTAGTANPDINNKSAWNMVPSDKVIDLIGEIEGFGEVPYRAHEADPLTIGYGHVILPGEDFGGRITREQARELKRRDIKTCVDEVNDWARIHNIKLSQNQFDALVSFHYNTGSIYTMEKLRDQIKSGNATPDELRAAFGEYYYSQGKRLFGLWRRRMTEADMFLNGEYQHKEREMPKDIEFDNI